MPRKRTASASVPPQRCFVKELAGETPPSFQAMKRLYGFASDLYGLRPWRVLDEDNLIVVRDSVSGELCYCSVMGALGEVLSMHAYIGAEGLRQFRKWKLKRSPIPANSSHLRTVFMWSSCPGLSCSGRIGSCLPPWGIRRAEAWRHPSSAPCAPAFSPGLSLRMRPERWLSAFAP